MSVSEFKLEHARGKDDSNEHVKDMVKAAIATESMNHALSIWNTNCGFHDAFMLSRFSLISCLSYVPNRSSK